MLKILLINPWIHDFAAYDFWAKPIGLLYLCAILKKNGYDVSYIDCLDRFHPKAAQNKSKNDGRGAYLKTSIKKPNIFEDIPRNFCRYGIKKEWLSDDLVSIKKPDLILVTSFMTYWYSGVYETISLIKEIFPDVPVILGGIYASLCTEHAKFNSGADIVLTGNFETHVLDLAAKYSAGKINDQKKYENIDKYPYPAFYLQNKIDYIPILTSRGCPYSCAYCASHYLYSKMTRRSPESVIDEISFWHDKFNVKNFVFYDDALLIDSENHINIILEKIIKRDFKINFHTPNALHIREISLKTAKLMYKAGFASIRLGLETINFDKRDDIDKKLTEKEFNKGIEFLKAAGFKKEQVGAYLLTGLPYQDLSEVEKSIIFVKKSEITPTLAYYTPIPHTKMWKDAVKCSRYDLENELLCTNNAVFPCIDDPFNNKKIARLKKIIKKA
jgi:radical SAM superfamily enzyme YgiQ (UPF0313 family)